MIFGLLFGFLWATTKFEYDLGDILDQNVTRIRLSIERHTIRFNKLIREPIAIKRIQIHCSLSNEAIDKNKYAALTHHALV